jgi:hypothetical protein
MANDKFENSEKLKKEAYELEQKRVAAETERYRKELSDQRILKFEDYLAKVRRSCVTKDEKGNDVLLWDKVLHEAHRYIHSGQESYNDWRSAMMSLLALYSLMVDAASGSIKSTLAPSVLTKLVGVREQALYPLRDKIMDKLRGEPRVDIPAMVHDVAMGDDNKLQIAPLKGIDGRSTQFTGADMQTVDLNPTFRSLVSLWLKDQGYEPGVEDGTYVNKAHGTADYNKVLTKEKFNELKDDKTHGLDAFLEENVELQFSPSPR